LKLTQLDTDFILREIEKYGFCVIKNYLDKNSCEKVASLMEDKISQFTRGDGMDYRHPNFENECQITKDFLGDQTIQEICDCYMNTPLIKKRCQAGLVIHDKNSVVSSGGGWHVDKRSRQFKAILYLSEVSHKSGFFSIIPSTSNRLEDFKTVPKFEGDVSMTRFEAKELEEKNILSSRIDITGEAGDLILVDTSNIHRGEEILEGKRYSLTNYYYN